ncbi:MAG: hypothetical protein F4X14_17590 [Caldilineaceae bacterium SB0661_bin_32]|uniref:Uncharacterized protein n=1 Tax=Caldilineaceae bacterium SB0661_bin_32 TaxID=2605255 RepID=A0A6B1DBL7_9CHLR|nr:hypothetical protein [Caldilineaceae bacterium SB0665_bin_25]MYC96782.1 hypothetical protein [Caldilineaceae bacterium SB0661_bin_32]
MRRKTKAWLDSARDDLGVVEEIIDKMKELQVPEFKNYQEEAEFWDNLDTADFMEDDGEWFRFQTSQNQPIQVAKVLDCREMFDNPLL